MAQRSAVQLDPRALLILVDSHRLTKSIAPGNSREPPVFAILCRTRDVENIASS
jgi:hypothetical protein